MPDLVLTRLSKSFAFSRIKRKIQYTSQYSHQISLDRHRSDATPWKARLSKAKSYYSFYNKLIERHLAPLPYYDWIANTERHESVVRKGKGSAGRPAIRGSSSMRPYSLGIYIENDESGENQNEWIDKVHSSLLSALQEASEDYQLTISLFANSAIASKIEQSIKYLDENSRFELNSYSIDSVSMRMEKIRQE